MIWFGLLSLIFCHIAHSAKDCVLDHRSLENTWEFKLNEDLFCNYFPSLPPTKNASDSVTVSVMFSIKYFSFSEDEEVFTLSSWIFLRWFDERLSWDPKKYDGIERFDMMSTKIWTPELKLFDTYDLDDYTFIHTPCGLLFSGKVLCIPRIQHSVICQTKLRDWPYDTQTCTLHFGSFRKKYPKVIFTFNNTAGIKMLGADYGAGWVITGLQKKENASSDLQLSLTFEIERQALDLAAIIIVPSILTSILTLTSLFIHIGDIRRIGLLCFSLLIHYNELQEISSYLPKKSQDVPLILLFVRGSLAITVFGLTLTMCLKFLRKRQFAPPAVVISANEFVLNSRLKYAVQPKWTVESESMKNAANEKVSEEWNNFINIVNSVSIFVFVIAYASIQIAFMPRVIPPMSF